jgi:recombination protein RecT
MSDSREVTRVTRSTAENNYLAITEAVKGNSASARAFKAMMGGSKQLADQFLAVVFSSLARNTKLLQDADPMSLLDAIKTAAAMGLVPLTEDGTIVVYKGIATFLPMYRGYLKRIRNSHLVEDIDVQIVYDDDIFELTLGDDPSVVHKPALPVRQEGGTSLGPGGYRGVYSIAWMPSGRRIVEWMTEAEINAIRDQYGATKAKTGRSTPWDTNYGEMARKTVLRRHSKRLPGAAVDALLAADERADAMRREEREGRESTGRDPELDAIRARALAATSGDAGSKKETTSEGSPVQGDGESP